MKNVYLDDVYQAPDKPIVLVVDCRVALYQLLDRYNKLKISSLTFAKCLWVYYLNALPSMIHSSLEKKADVHLIIVDDWRTGDNYNYWREDWLQENYSEGLAYKGNRGTESRKDRPSGYNELLEACHNYAEQADIPVFRQAGFEADDWAGACYRLTDGSYQTILVSVDNDWGILTSHEKDIIMYINGSFRVPISTIRGEYEYLQYYKIREDFTMSNTQQIVDFKVKYGDAGDNIAPGTPREVIDLRNPPIKPDSSKLKVELSNLSFKPNKTTAIKALQKIVKMEFTNGTY